MKRKRIGNCLGVFLIFRVRGVVCGVRAVVCGVRGVDCGAVNAECEI